MPKITGAKNNPAPKETVPPGIQLKRIPPFEHLEVDFTEVKPCRGYKYLLVMVCTVRTGHGTTDWFQIGKGVQGCIFSPCLFNLYADYIMRNAGLEEAHAGIKIAGRNMNNLKIRR